MERREALKLSASFMGYALSGVVFSSMLNGCKIDNSLDWSPVFFSKEQGNTIAEIAEHILPKTDTPGAKDMLVHRFIDQLISKCYDENAQKEFVYGLENFQAECKLKTGNTFENCTEEERNAIFTAQENIPFEAGRSVWGFTVKQEKNNTFYKQLKGLVIFTYFSSEEIGENVLAYEPIPGKYNGCIPLDQVGKVYSL